MKTANNMEIVEDRTFLAGERRVMWRATLFKGGDKMLLRIQRVGARRVSGMVIPWDEIPDLIRILNGIREKT